jgi:hypothetical protein
MRHLFIIHMEEESRDFSRYREATVWTAWVRFPAEEKMFFTPQSPDRF